MRYLQHALDLAEARGYLRYPEVLALHSRVPNWFRDFGTDAGATEFEVQRGFQLPAAMGEFYGCLPLACFLEATMDGEVFLVDFATLIRGDLPPVVTWSAEPHLVFSFHNHSGMVLAGQLGVDNPLVFCGSIGDSEPMSDDERPPELSSELVFRGVDRHEARLDYWQGVYEKCQANPTEATRLGGVEWIRSMPRMAQRLKYRSGTGWRFITSYECVSARKRPNKRGET